MSEPNGNDLPKLRNPDIIPLQSSGRQMVALRDRQGVSDQTVVIDEEMFYILRFFDGAHSKLDIKTEYTRRFGGLLFTEELDDLIQKLDSALLLENKHFLEVKEEQEREFIQSKTRPSSLAGKSYPEDAKELQDMLAGFFKETPSDPDRPEPPGPPPRGVVAPHIDLRRGGPTYALAYREVARCDGVETFVILGVDHAGMEHVFSATRKPFETPLGTVDVDTDLISLLQNSYGYDLFACEAAHRTEHSIEFQVVFLKYVLKEKPFRIVPILCGNFEKMILEGKSPAEVPEVADFVKVLRGIVSERKGSVSIIAGADLSHVGRRFGDTAPVSLPALEGLDRATLEYVESIDSEGFYANIKDDGNRRGICGLPAIYVLLAATGAKTGKLLEYTQWPERETGSVVTGAAMALY